MIYMYFAPGFEEVEAIATLDVIRRAGIDIKSIGVGNKTVTGSHNITILCDDVADNAQIDGIDGVILPGGMPGTKNLMADATVQSAIDYCVDNDKLVCAICAAPMILGHKGILNGKNATCFPGFEKDLLGAITNGDFVVTDGNIITGKGMGSAVNFGLAIVAAVKGEKCAEELKATLQCS